MSDNTLPAPQTFLRGDWSIRSLYIDGEPWFVASDVAKALEIQNTTQAVQRLDPDERSMFNIGRQGKANVVNEFGLYALVLQSRKAEAKAFKRWITHDVIPAIRKTGSYVDPSSITRLQLAQMVLDAEHELAAVKPKAAKYDAIADAAGSWSIGDAAKLLCKAGYRTGQNRLFAELVDRRWLHRGRDGIHAQQWALERGWLELKAHAPFVDRSGETRNPTPQVRITGRGFDQLLDLHGLARPLVAIDGDAA